MLPRTCLAACLTCLLLTTPAFATAAATIGLTLIAAAVGITAIVARLTRRR